MTLPQMIRQSHEKWKSNTCMMVKKDGKYVGIRWENYYGKVLKTAAALVKMGVEPGDRVAILSPTRMEWAIADAGALTAGAITVPIYPSLTPGEVKDLIVRSGAKVVFLSDAEQADKLNSVAGELGFVVKLVVFEKAGIPARSALPFVALEDLIAGIEPDPKLIEERLASRTGDDVATIIFTSGTTGEPKGVMLTHDNIIANVNATLEKFEFGPGDVHLAHLPLAHIFERMGGYYLMMQSGAVIAYAENIQTVAANISEVQPTLVVTVPRIFEKIYAGIQAKAMEAPKVVKALTFWALDIAEKAGAYVTTGKAMPMGFALKYMLADKLVYSKIRKKMGGRIRFFVSGGAPLAPELATFFLVIGIPVMEGYGLTETSPVIAANTHDHLKVGTVGHPLDNVEVRIAEDGEIIVRGPSIFKGYYNNEAATAEVLSPDGWFATGDIGLIDSEGYLKITDRKKDLIVTAGGKNIAPQKIENILKMDKFIAEAMLYGDKKNFLTALIVPDFAWLEKYAAHKGIKYETLSSLAKDPQIVDLITRRVEETQQEHEIASYEMVKKFVLLDHEFSMTEGEVTPTLKLKRKAVTAHYRDQLEALYEK